MTRNGVGRVAGGVAGAHLKDKVGQLGEQMGGGAPAGTGNKPRAGAAKPSHNPNILPCRVQRGCL